MKKNFGLVIASVGLFLGAMTSNASANIVSDGNFDAPYGGGSFTTYSAVSNFGPWNVTSGSVDLIGGYWQAPAGAGSVDMDGYNAGTISQNLATGAGSYVLHFSLSGNLDGGNPLKALQVSVGNALQDYTFNTTGITHSNMGYVNEALAFNTSGPTNLVFSSLTNTGLDGCCYGAVVGNVSVSSVPLPASLPMFAATLLGLFGFHSFRKRQHQVA